jgi:hypothetical protein
MVPARAVHSFCHNRLKGNDILQHIRVNIDSAAARLYKWPARSHRGFSQIGGI